MNVGVVNMLNEMVAVKEESFSQQKGLNEGFFVR